MIELKQLHIRDQKYFYDDNDNLETPSNQDSEQPKIIRFVAVQHNYYRAGRTSGTSLISLPSLDGQACVSNLFHFTSKSGRKCGATTA